jgi:hypothetical protein
VDRTQAGVSRAVDIGIGVVADVDRLGRVSPEFLENRPEGSFVGFAGRERAGDDGRIEQVRPSERVEFALLGEDRAVGQQSDAVLAAEIPDDFFGTGDRDEGALDRHAVGTREILRRGLAPAVGKEVREDRRARLVGQVATVGVDVRRTREGGRICRGGRLVENDLALAFGNRECVIEVEDHRGDRHTEPKSAARLSVVPLADRYWDRSEDQ